MGAIGSAFDWLPEKIKREIVDAIVPAPGTEGRPTPAVPGSPLDPATFDPTAPRFIADPYPDFTTFRRDYPVCYVPRHRAYWVFSHALVRQLYTNPYILKGNPNGNLPRGILSMEAMEHAPVRAALEPQFDAPDRKFAAVAHAHPGKPPVWQAADSKWLNWWPALAAQGVRVDFLCPDDACRFYAKKFPNKPAPSLPPP